MAGYTCFADYYDELIQNVDYKKIADYILKILKNESKTPGDVLDLACGTGSLTIELAKRGINVLGVDASCEMLSIAKNKSIDHDLNIMFVCQKMQDLNLCSPVDTVICTLDSLNHLDNFKQIERTFEKVSFFLKKGGYFIFDMNTLYKHEVVLGNNTFVYETNDVFCVWQNSFDEKSGKVKINLDFFKENNTLYYRESEEFFENAYDFEKIENALKNAKMEVLHKYDDLSFNNYMEQSQRVFFVAKKI